MASFDGNYTTNECVEHRGFDIKLICLSRKIDISNVCLGHMLELACYSLSPEEPVSWCLMKIYNGRDFSEYLQSLEQLIPTRIL